MRPSLWWPSLLLMLLCLLAPLAVVELPPLADFPNHLARGYVLSTGGRDPAFSRMFAADWALIPNLATDLLLPPLMQVIDPYTAGRIVVAVALLLPVTGVVALNHALFGTRSPWPLAAGFLGYSAIFLLGFVNFVIGIGVGLWGAAAWVALARRPIAQVAAGVVFGVVAFVCHLYGFIYFGVLIACFEMAELLGGRGRFVRRTLSLALTAFGPIALYLSTSFAATSSGVDWQSLDRKLLYLLTPVLTYSRTLACLTAAVLVLATGIWAARRRLALAGAGWFAIPSLLLLYALLPVGAKGAYWIDTRIPLMAALAVIGVTRPRIGRREAVLATIVLGGLFVVRQVYIVTVWRGAAADVRDVRTVLAAVPNGTRLLTIDVTPSLHPTDTLPRNRALGPGFPLSYWHYGAIAALDRHAFWADGFTLPGQQPIRVLDPYRLSTDGGASKPPDISALADPAFTAGLHGRFDYVLVLNANLPHDVTPPKSLQKLGQSGFAALYQVARDRS